MRRTPLTTTPRRQHDAQHRAVKTALRGRGSSAGQIDDGVRIVVARAALSHSEVIVFLNESVGRRRRREAMTSIHRYAVTRTRPSAPRASHIYTTPATQLVMCRRDTIRDAV